MKVVLVGTIGNVGGPSIHIRNLVSEMSKLREVELHVITKGEEDKIMKRGNVIVHVLRLFGFYILREIIHAWRVRNKISEIDPDIVHYQGISPYVLFHNEYPYLLTVHGIFSIEMPERMHGWKYFVLGLPRILLERIVLSKVKNIIAISPYVKKAIAWRTNAKIRVIPTGVDKDYFNNSVGFQEEANRLLFVGNISAVKGLLILLKSLKKVKNSISSVKLAIAGEVKDFNYFDTVVQVIKNDGLENNVTYRGALKKDTLIMEYQKCSICVLPSKIETMGIVLLEAMASCKPVIATNVGGIPYFVKDGQNGFLVEAGNVDELAEKILFLLKKKNLRKEIGCRAKQTAKEFDWTKIIQGIMDFYNDVQDTRALTRAEFKLYYEKEAEYYSNHQKSMYFNVNPWRRYPHKWRKRLIDKFLSKAINLLDVGCAEGLYVEGRKIPCVGVDIAKKYVLKAKKKSYNADFIVADICNLPFRDNTFDHVLCSEVLEHVPDWRMGIDEVIRVAENVVITVPLFTMWTRLGSFFKRHKKSVFESPGRGHVNSFEYRDFLGQLMANRLTIKAIEGVSWFPVWEMAGFVFPKFNLKFIESIDNILRKFCLFDSMAETIVVSAGTKRQQTRECCVSP